MGSPLCGVERGRIGVSERAWAPPRAHARASAGHHASWCGATPLRRSAEAPGFGLGPCARDPRGVAASDVLQDDDVCRLRLYIASACCRLRKYRQVSLKLEQRLAEEQAKGSRNRDPGLERHLSHALNQRASHYRADTRATVARVRRQFNDNRVLASGFKLLLRVLQRDHGDACGALVRVAAVAGADGSKM